MAASTAPLMEELLLKPSAFSSEVNIVGDHHSRITLHSQSPFELY